MLFNSLAFILYALPIFILGYFCLGRFAGKTPALTWLILCSFFFYASWEPKNLILLCGSALFNYAIGQMMMRLRTGRGLLLALGIGLNLALLGYFKYMNFFIDNVNSIFGSELVFSDVVLPLAISFFTFQKLAYLLDVYNDRVSRHGFLNFFLFVFFFPQLIAGPIVHHSEVMPQFARPDVVKFNSRNVAFGIFLFAIGLCKKSVFADTLATYTVQPFNAATQGWELTLIEAWGAVIAFTYQVYFDFSAYSDMAIGIALMFNIRLPINFNSPLQATSILDLWRRWHITLTRFLTDYVYTPLSIWLMRKTLHLRLTRWLAFLCAVAVPLNMTFLVSGLWHGAGWNFVIFGVITGIAMTVNSAWRQARLPSIPSFLAWTMTMLTFVISVVFFRAETFDAAISILRGMCGLNGFGFPAGAREGLGALGDILAQFGVRFDNAAFAYFRYPAQLFWLVLIGVIVHTLPNSQQIVFPFLSDPGNVEMDKGGRLLKLLRVEPRARLLARSGAAGATMGALLMVCIVGIVLYQSHLRDAVPEFIYFQF